MSTLIRKQLLTPKGYKPMCWVACLIEIPLKSLNYFETNKKCSVEIVITSQI